MERDIRFDYIRVVSMFYIVAVLHLLQYLSLPSDVNCIYNSWIEQLLSYLALSLFSMISGYLIGSKYKFGKDGTNVLLFYKKRIVRFYPLFFIASLALYFIGFNSLQNTIKGLLGIAVFSTGYLRTMWYISMLMVFYLLTPIINRNSTLWKITSSSLLILSSVIAYYFYRTPYFGFLYNLAFYCFGVICSDIRLPFINQDALAFNSKIQCIINVGVISLFFITLPFAYHFCQDLLWGILLIGVFAAFAFSSLITKLRITILDKMVKYCSYGSMVCYLFHRLFYYVGLIIYNPDNQLIRGGYLLIVVFPICVVASYYIQKIYDAIAKKLQIMKYNS